jgi:dimethylaniline monooxygenase (N-oxide forming)
MKKNLKTVAIIGAGISGLVSAKYALENGLMPFVIEKSKSKGGLWSLDSSSFIWDEMIARASIYSQMFSDHPWPSNAQTFPSVQEINAYILSYIRRFSLEQYIFLNTNVTSVKKTESEKWQITSVNIETSITTSETFDFVIVASGELSVPLVPIIEKAEVFSGIQMHSSEFKLNDPRFLKKTVVVVI